MRLPDITYRSTAVEAMDDFNLGGAALEEALDKISHINRFLGGNRITVQALNQVLKPVAGAGPIRIADYGCGNGDMLRTVAGWGRSKGFDLHLTGLDANGYSLQHAARRSAKHPGIRYLCRDFLAPDFEPEEAEVVLFTLTLHHFKEADIVGLLEKILGRTKRAVIINDLHRSHLAYFLFAAMTRVMRLSPMTRSDGMLSIIKGFKKKELEEMAARFHFKKHDIRWKWAFRYRWIISNICE